MITVYGIKNCDTCRNALKALKAQGREHSFHDLRADGLSEAEVTRWLQSAGWEKLLNRRGTTWRKLPEAEREDLDEGKVKRLMLEQPTLIKRPVFEVSGEVVVGFDAAAKERLEKLCAG
ncbi:arsenate reductase [Denitrobaculum tricleocarpae]|uniref:Arsenate reductase n=1 Tax=Denitrobaculum tricleocarpae TaxID=2591009 RepID=A0A545U1S1_9PROT|nr:arsenate reductase [Denitrobaculum tricleocarpae]TQV83429.1 arsenate reductase [Denitrobaculum tricleocarpae]